MMSSTDYHGMILHRTRGSTQGPITRLMSPGDLGQFLKPFVFLDIFSIPNSRLEAGFGLHPHSGIATVTVIVSGDARFDDGEGLHGTLAYGGVEWCRAGKGVWHGRELGPGSSDHIEGFQLWLALPPELELAAPDNQYLEAGQMPVVGPATVILGEYKSVRSPVRTFEGVSYLLVTLEPGAAWDYDVAEGHEAIWFAVASGVVAVGENQLAEAGEMVLLDPASGAAEFRSMGPENAVFVVASARPHLHELHLGNHSVHTSKSSLQAGENHILNLRAKLIERERAGRDGSIVPVLK
jgi:redox-sensitive bicupin YhaK (pirin superfamily)